MTTPPSDSAPTEPTPPGPMPSEPMPPGWTPPPAPGSPYGSPPYGAPAPPPPASGPYGATRYPAGPFPGAGQPYQPPPSKAMAVWSLILGWVPCLLSWVLAVIFAIMVLSRSKDGRPHGRGLAIGGLVGVGVWIVLIVTVLIIDPRGPNRDSNGHVTRASDIAIEDLRVGDCGDEPGTDLTKQLHIVPCEQPHVLEVAATFQLTGDTYPGEKTVKRQSIQGCLQRLRGLEQLRGHAELRGGYIEPSGKTWDVLKRVVCLVETDSPTTGSVIDPS